MSTRIGYGKLHGSALYRRERHHPCYAKKGMTIVTIISYIQESLAEQGKESAIGCSCIVIILDLFPKIGYAVLMEEQIVQYSEQVDTNEETTTLPVLPAPMVERAFRLLDLLSGT